MNAALLYIVGFIVRLLPDTRCFPFKAWLYRLCGVRIGSNVKICSSARILGVGNLTIGNNVWIGHDVMIVCGENLIIGSNVNIAPRVYIGTGTHRIDRTGPSIAGDGINLPITIGDGAWVCACSSILAGVNIGECSIIAMGAVVVTDVPSYEIWGGVPSKKIKEIVQ